jgi:hypothetical protein
MAEPTTYINSDTELCLKSGAAIVLMPGDDAGASGYTGVAIEGSITSGTWEGDTIALSHGGTGATTAAGALKNLGIVYGTWTPKIYSATVSSYTRKNGWYLKVGNTVTVGFDLYCTVASGQTGTVLKISGLPYTPISGVQAGGGGECSGYYGAANVLFQGWKISDGYICGRGHTYSSSAGTRYTTDVYCGTSAMMCSGTITYQTAS